MTTFTTDGIGGVLFSGSVEVPVIDAGLPLITAAMTSIFDVDAELPLITAAITVNEQTIATALPLITAEITAYDTAGNSLAAPLTVLGSAITGGVHAIDTQLPLVGSALSAYAGTTATLAARLTVISADITGLPGGIGTIDAALPRISATSTGFTGYIATISTSLPAVGADLSSYAGHSAVLATTLPLINAALDAGFGATGTISAALPAITAAITVLAQATTQELVMVVGTRNNAVSTYEDYPFNSFCELNGVYYGAGPDGLYQLDTGDLDGAAAISAGLGTGLMDLGDPHLKRIYDAYMTLRTAGDLTFTITVDEGTPVILTMNAQQFATFIQRRVVTPKGLLGKSWKFEINNVDGSDFDFGHLGFNIAVGSRRGRG
jgi:hypothetical protein